MLFLVCALWFLSHYQRLWVSGSSMYPTFEGNGTEIVYGRFCFSKLDRGDIIVVAHPMQTEKVLKRLVAFGGEKICVIQNLDLTYSLVVITCDGTTIIERTLNVGAGQDLKISIESTSNQTFLKEGKKFVEINGNKYLKIPENCVFYLGDNVTSSWDCSEYGAVPQMFVLSKIEFITTKNGSAFIQIITQIFDKIFK